MALVSQPPGLFYDARRIIFEPNMTLGDWIELYSPSRDSPQSNTGQHIAD